MFQPLMFSGVYMLYHAISTPPKFNSSPLKNNAWKTILSFWGSAYFQGRTVNFQGRKGGMWSKPNGSCWDPGPISHCGNSAPLGIASIKMFASPWFTDLDTQKRIFLVVLAVVDCTIYPCITRWWFQNFFMFTPTWARFPIWLRWVETTNQINMSLSILQECRV